MTFYIKQNDTSPAIKYQLQDNDGNAIDLSGFQEVKFHLKKDNSAEAKVEDDTNGNVTVTDVSNGIVKYEWQSGDTETVGDYNAEWQVTFSGGKVETFPNHRDIQVKIREEIT